MSFLWDFWSRYYDGLWVQKYSLGPTRERVLFYVDRILRKEGFKNRPGSVSLLDVGCGTGQLLGEAKGRFGKSLQVMGLDSSAGMLKRAKKSLPGIRFIRGNADALNGVSHVLSENRYSIITCTHSLPYYRCQKKSLEDMAGFLEKGGYLIVACASARSAYDALCLKLVGITAGGGRYPAKKDFYRFSSRDLRLVYLHSFKEKWFMPSIVTAILKKR